LNSDTGKKYFESQADVKKYKEDTKESAGKFGVVTAELTKTDALLLPVV
jgi:hypothetical protein